MSPRVYWSVVALALLATAGVVAWVAGADEREQEERERLHRGAEEFDRRARQREYEEATRPKCVGGQIEIINASGDARYVCADEAHTWKSQGWIVRTR